MEKQNNNTTEAVLVITFSYSLTQEQLKAAAQDFAENVKPTVDGLTWKIFLNQPEKKRSGGIYLFRNAESARNYLNSPYVEKLREAPGLSDFSIEIFETMAEASIAAGASIGASAG